MTRGSVRVCGTRGDEHCFPEPATGTPAARVVMLAFDEVQAPLLKALDDPDRFVAAHVLLSLLENRADLRWAANREAAGDPTNVFDGLHVDLPAGRRPRFTEGHSGIVHTRYDHPSWRVDSAEKLSVRQRWHRRLERPAGGKKLGGRPGNGRGLRFPSPSGRVAQGRPSRICFNDSDREMGLGVDTARQGVTRVRPWASAGSANCRGRKRANWPSIPDLRQERGGGDGIGGDCPRWRGTRASLQVDADTLRANRGMQSPCRLGSASAWIGDRTRKRCGRGSATPVPAGVGTSSVRAGLGFRRLNRDRVSRARLPPPPWSRPRPRRPAGTVRRAPFGGRS